MSFGWSGFFLRAAPLLLALLIARDSRAEEALFPGIGKVMQITGPPEFLPRKGKPRPLGEGDLVKPGDRIRTDEGDGAVIEYEDGGKLGVGVDSEVGILPSDASSARILIRKGSLRGQVPVAAPAAGGKPPPMRYRIRTRSAVLGVRGTDFLMSFDATSEKSSVHTLEGKVEVGANDAGLDAGRGVPVAENQELSATPRGFSPVQTFDRAAFLANLASSQPTLAAQVAGQIPTGRAGRTGGKSGLDLLRFMAGASMVAWAVKEEALVGQALGFGFSLGWMPRYRFEGGSSLQVHATLASAGLAEGRHASVFQVGIGYRLPILSWLELEPLVSLRSTSINGPTVGPDGLDLQSSALGFGAGLWIRLSDGFLGDFVWTLTHGRGFGGHEDLNSSIEFYGDPFFVSEAGLVFRF
ncbi:MAG: FecR domain-containing protein [Bdellovibrionales bacterium]|nr:FecR domain-containing protein [Bdellovibrionales bacterium]